jgi:hypothetical protein
MVDKKQTISPAALRWRECRADLLTSSSATPHSAFRIPNSALGTLRTRHPLDNQARSSPIVPNKAKHRCQ